MGIWGFITLIIQYLNQINFGITHSVNAIIAIHKNKEWYVQKIIGTALTLLIGLSLLVVLFFTANELFNLNLGRKYNFSVFAPAVALIGILGYFNSLFSSIFRVYGRIIEIAINQSAFPVLVSVAILFFEGEDLLWALVGANFLAFLFSLGLFIIKSPVKLKLLFIGRLIKTIQIRGWHLFVYNTSFYLIIISTRSFISGYYTVEEFGYFTFAFSLANVVLLLLESFSFLIFPKLINRLASATNEKVVSLLEMLRDAYITSSHLLIHAAILLFPLFLLFFPQYKQSADSFKLIALTVVLYTNSFGYSGLLIAKGEEKKLGNLAFFILIMNVISALILIVIFHVNFAFVIVATMVTYFIYVFLLGYIGRKNLQLSTTIFSILKDIYPIRLFIPYLLSLGLIIFETAEIYFMIPLLLFLSLNYKSLIKIKQLAKTVIVKPDFINI